MIVDTYKSEKRTDMEYKGNPLHRIGTDILNCIVDFLDPTSYLQFSSTSKEYYKLRDQPHYQNVARDTCKMLKAVFDDGRNVLMHGPGGCGKTFALGLLHKKALSLGKRIVMSGTTGISADGMPEGSTIHSFSGLGKGTMKLEQLQTQINQDPRKALRKFSQWKSVDILVIDEVSMLGTRLFHLLDYVARFVREDPRPFGGIQLVFSGDFLQLPPIGDRFIFTLENWEEMKFIWIPFVTSYRQRHDHSFFRLLQRLRMGLSTPLDLQHLKSRMIDAVPDEIIANVGRELVPPFMFSRHAQVNKLNKERFDSFTGPTITVNAVDTFWKLTRRRDDVTGRMVSSFDPYNGQVRSTPQLMDRVEHRQPATLDLKHKAQYIVTKNMYRFGVVNGAMALLNVEMSNPPLIETDDIKLVLKNGKTIPLNQMFVKLMYCINPLEGIYLQRAQYVLRVGYAVTIHSAQGMTLDKAVVNAGTSVFASAQTYVACSRVRRLCDLYLLDFHPNSLKVHQEARQYVANLEGITLPRSSGNLKRSSSSSSSKSKKRCTDRTKGLLGAVEERKGGDSDVEM